MTTDKTVPDPPPETTPTAMNAHLFAFALAADSRFPTGSHAHSAGLEPALLGGMPPDEVVAFVRTRLRTVTRVEAGTAVVALAYLRAGLDLEPVRAAWAARTPSGPLRQASVELGRGYARVLRHLAQAHSDDDRLLRDRPVESSELPESSNPATKPTDTPKRMPRPLAMAFYARHVGLSAQALATLVGYDDVQTVMAALLKLEPLDPAKTVSWALSLIPDVEALASSVSNLSHHDEIPAPSTPLLEQWQIDHATTTRRLFRA